MTNIFNGVPIDTQAFSIFDATYYIFYKDYKYYIYNYATNTTSAGVAFGNGTSVMSQIPTGQTINMGYVDAPNSSIYINVGTNWYKYDWVLSSGIPTFTYVQTISNSSWFGGGMPTSGWDGLGPYTIGANMWLFNGSSYNQFAYGGTGQPFDGLPHDIGCVDIRIDDTLKGWAFKGDKYYEISLTYSGIGGGTALIGRRPNGGTLVSSGTLPSASNNIFNGVPWDHSASVGFDNDPTITYFFRMNPSTSLNEVFIHDETTNTTTVSDIGIPTMFPDLPTNIPISHGAENQPSNIGEHLIYWVDNALSPPLQFIVTTSPTAVPVYIGSTNLNYIYHTGSSVEQVSTGTQWISRLGFDFFYAARGSISHYLPTGSYGGVGQPYAGLPYIGGGTGVETAYCSILRVTGQDNQVYLFTPTGDAIILDLLAQQISSTVPYGPISSAPVVPPTPLPDIEVVYQAPAQFNLFSSDVALVTETQYGWNFTKTILTADKMELYLYHSSAPGAVPFNYNQLRDIKINMKNNLILPPGEIFVTVWTGPPVAPNWYNYKDIYNFTPPLGTTIDVDLVEHILNLTDTRTDPILAIALHSNSSQQQVNCDVERVSFEILLPATNETQRVIVKLQNNFIVVDDKYWDLVDSAVGKLGTTIRPDFEIVDFTPNIIAGNYPQSGTAKGPPQGTAWYLAGTWSEWTQTSANVWAPNGNTVQFTSNTVNPGLDTNGAGWIGTLGGVALTGTWSPQPFNWHVLTGNIFNIIHTNGSTINFSPLIDLPQPNNFTVAQAESGMFSSSNVGTMATSVLISNSVSPFKSPIFPVEIDLTFLSETQVIMRRSWEIIDTTYTISSSNVLSGQYISPTYPNDDNPASHLPDSYTKATPWVVLANNDSQFDIQFSGGLNNTITADGAYNMAVNPVGPSPITYSWIANYYTSADVLISPVVGFGATGSVSNFNITLASVPASAEYILYVCTSSENVQAFASLVIIQASPAIPFVLDFQNQSAQIVVDATYSVTPNPVDAGTTYTYTATFNNEFDASLGVVPGFTQTTPSTFPFVYANMPLGTKYIEYGCTATGGNQGGETARLAISIIPQIPPAPQPFDLEFDGGVFPINITADGTYTMTPYPTESALIITYTYTANYFEGTTDLGPVVGFDVTGQSSSFPFTFAGMPAGATYIKYICSASGTGLQNGETAQSIIGIVEPCSGGSGNSINSREQNTIGIYENKDYIGSSKKVMDENVSSLELQLVDGSDQTKILINNTINYEIETSFKGEF